MATKKSMWVLFGILVISAWVLGSVITGRSGDYEVQDCRDSY